MDKRQRYTDQAMNAFKKTNLFYASSPFLGIQDPTVFGFKLLFHFDMIDSPLLYGANTDINEAPTNTAAGFLKSIKDEQRLYYLEKFLYLLKGINNETPWYFQTLSGLKDAWMHDYSKPFIGEDKKITIECIESMDLRVTALLDLYRKACFDWKYRRQVVPRNLRQFKLSVYIYESRIINNPNSIATTDETELPPVEFGYGGNIQGEASKQNAELVSRLTGSDETRNDPNTPNVNIVEGVKMSTTRNLYHFDFCEFGTMEPGHLETINNAEPAEVKQKIEIMYQDVEEDNMYNFWTSDNPITDAYVTALDKAALDDPQLQDPGVPVETLQKPPIEEGPKDPIARLQDMADEGKKKLDQLKGFDRKGAVEKFKGGANAFGKDLANAAGNQIIDAAQQRAQALITGLILGNIYGLSPAALAQAANNPQLAASRILDAGSSIVNDRRKSGFQGERDTGAF